VIADLAGRKKDLRDKHVQAVLQLAQKNGNGQLDVFGGVRVEKAYDRLLFYAGNTADAAASHAGNTANEAAGSPVTLTGRAPEDSHSELPSPAFAYSRRWPMSAADYECRVLDFDGDMAVVPRKQCTKWFDYDKIGALPSFRTRRGGDRITLDESGRSKTIARYMIDAKVPAQLRDRIVLPTIGGEILWIPAGAPDSANGNSSDSGRISAAYMVSEHTSRILEIRWKAGNGPAPRDDREAGSRTPAGSIDNMDTGINNN
jgi:tRNA(Ile)-lysidine synthetase-like protein